MAKGHKILIISCCKFDNVTINLKFILLQNRIVIIMSPILEILKIKLQYKKIFFNDQGDKYNFTASSMRYVSIYYCAVQCECGSLYIKVAVVKSCHFLRIRIRLFIMMNPFTLDPGSYKKKKI